MSDYILCLKCGAVFNDDETIRIVVDRHPYGEGTASEYASACPQCRCTEIAPAVQCEICGEYIPEDEAEYHPITEETICHSCFESVLMRAEAAWDD